MSKVTEIYLYEEGGKFYLVDQYGHRRVQFSSAEGRQKWIEGIIGKVKIIEGKPDVEVNLSRF